MGGSMTHRLAINFADGKTVFASARPGELLLDAAMRHGISLPVDCREGVCGTCRGRCDSGSYAMDYVDEETLSESDLAARAVLACQTRVTSDAAFSFDIPSRLCQVAAEAPRRAVVTGVERVSAETVILSVQVAGPQLDFLPGQYARLSAPGWTQTRAYSFANRPNAENRLQFLIRLLPGGLMGRFLTDECRPGVELSLEAPFGSFFLRQVERPLVLAAGGTGLAAFLGMLEEMAESTQPLPPIRLYYGVNRVEDLCARDQLEALREKLADFDFVTVITQPPESYAGLSGYVADHFDPGFFADRPADIYVCGPPPMVDSVRGWLDRHAHPDHKLYFEKFLASGVG